jgi:WD40 repeat protein
MGATFMPDGKKLLGLGDDGRVAMFRADNGRLVSYLHDRGSVLVEPRVTPDSTRILTRSEDERVRVFEARTGSLLCVLDGHRAPVVDLDFSSSGKRLLTAGEDGAVKIWRDACEWERVAVERVGDGAALSPDGRHLVLWDPLGAELVDLASKERRPLGTRPEPPGTDKDSIQFASFSHDGSLVATAGADSSARVWRLSDRGVARSFTHTGKVRTVRFSADGKSLLTTSDDRSARIWDLTTGEPRVLLAHAAAVTWATYFADDRRILTRSADDVVTIWDATTGAAVKTLPYKAGKFAELDVAAKAARFAVPCDDGVVRIWDDAGAPIGTLRGTNPEDWRARLSPDGKRAITSAGERTSRVWDVTTGSVSFVLDGDRAKLRDAAFTPDGAFVLASGDDGAARVFDARNGKLLDVADGHREAIDGLDLASGGRAFLTRASAGLSEEVVVWTLPEEKRDVIALRALVARSSKGSAHDRR